MKRIVRYACFALAVMIFLAIPVYAMEATEPRASIFFMSSSVYLYKISDPVFEAWFDVTATGTMEEIGASEIKIQRSSDGSNWTTMKTYTMEDYSHLIDENSTTHAACVRYTGTRGYYYRAYIELYAKNSVGTGGMPRYTSAIYIPKS